MIALTKVVKKFGGTSLAEKKRIDLAAGEVAESLEEGNQVTVVVSAMGGYGDPYATDTLIELLEEVSPEIDSRKKDLMMSCGETISASLFSHYLDSKGFQAVPMTGYKAGIFTDSSFGDAEIIDVDPARINHQTLQGKPVVLAGFQGRTVRGEITTLGRGGSDTTALAVGARLGVDRVELFTDVPGVAVADPGLVESPRYFSSISRNALMKLAKSGAEVVHPPAISRAKNSEVPLYVKCLWNRENETFVGGSSSSKDCPIGIAVDDGFTALEGGGDRILENPDLCRDAEFLFCREKGSDLALVPEEVEGAAGGGFKKLEGLSLLTVVVTVPELLSEVKEKILSSVDSDLYVRRAVEGGCIRFLTEVEDRRPLAERIYGLYYRD